MKIGVFDSHHFEETVLAAEAARYGFTLVKFESRLSAANVGLLDGLDVVCAFVNDRIDADVLSAMQKRNIRLIALRCAGFNNVDIKTAARLGIEVVRVPEYSPFAVAEHAVALILALNRKICRANSRVRDGNFSLDGLVGFDLHGKTVGIVGTGRIGSALAKIMLGFGCRILAHDPEPCRELLDRTDLRYTSLDAIFAGSDIVSLHLPLTGSTRHLVDQGRLASMKKGAMLINTGRGALIDTAALIESLKSGHLGSAGLDVYEEEEKFFFQDLSSQVILDDVLARLFTFPNVLITAHQGFLTQEALHNIAETTLQSIADFAGGRPLRNRVIL